MRDPSSSLFLFIYSLNVSTSMDLVIFCSETSFDVFSTQPYPELSMNMVEGLSLDNFEQLK